MKVFLSYPSEHLEAAVEVKNFVRSVGVECWFDKDSLVAGEDWDRARHQGLVEADVFLVLCAAQTTGRNGVYQREINEALELLRDRRLGTIYIIPLRLEDAPLPSELGRLQYVDHFEGAWRRKLAVGLARATTEKGESVPAALTVAATQPEEGGSIDHAILEERPEGSYELNWFTYTMEGEYWDFVNGVIRSKALGGLYETRRQMAEWWQTSGSDWTMSISEFHRRDKLVSLVIGTSSYFSRAAHPNHGLFTINFLGEEAGIVGAQDLFEATGEGFSFLTDYVNLDLRRQYGGNGEKIDITSYAETYGWEFYEHFNFNEAGMRLNLSAASGLPHALGMHEVYIPWEHVGQLLAPVSRRILLGTQSQERGGIEEEADPTNTMP
ncbi:toll/interleukin-1 receptor domain-containing protein [Sphingopyxis fribergensis]